MNLEGLSAQVTDLAVTTADTLNTVHTDLSAQMDGLSNTWTAQMGTLNTRMTNIETGYFYSVRYDINNQGLTGLQQTNARTNLGLGAAATQALTAFLQPANNLSDVANAATARGNLALGNVENKSSATIRGELTSANVVAALGYTPTVGSFRNRLLNGAMRIDQRRAGAALLATGTAYVIDRWQIVATQSSKLTVGQNQGAGSLPAGFTQYLGATVTTTLAVAASDIFAFEQIIEGVNVSDLGWGTASAKTVTLSFLAYASITGTYGGAVKNAATRAYPFSFALVANTWTQVSVVIPGDTAGTWNTDNTGGLFIFFGLGVGATFTAPAAAWAAGNFVSANGAQSILATAGAVFRATGVQLEPGSVATPFEARAFATELRLCQRYYEHNMPTGAAPADGVAVEKVLGAAFQTNGMGAGATYKVEKRVAPTLTLYKGSGANATAGLWGFFLAATWGDITGTAVNTNSSKSFFVTGTPTIANGSASLVAGGWAADAEL